MKGSFLKKFFAVGLITSTIATGGTSVSASNNIQLWYTYGAPSSANQLTCYGGYESFGKNSVVLHVPTFNVTYTGPLVSIETTPALNMTSFNEAITYYRTVQYKNGATSKKGTYVNATSKVSNYDGQRNIGIYGEIREGNG